MSETFSLVRVYANDPSTAERIRFYLDDATRLDFEDEVSQLEREIFRVMEFAPNPVEIEMHSENVIDAWFENTDLSELGQVLSAFKAMPVKQQFVFFADDEEYREYFKYDNGQLTSIYRIEQDEELDDKLWALEWDGRAMDLVLKNVYG